MSLKYFALALAATAAALPGSALKARQSNDDNPCEPCQPPGATGMDPPAVGSDLSSLYTNVLDSVNGISFSKRDGRTAPRSESGFCCAASLDCVNVQAINIPMCYDKFTTNFKFPDGSFGSLTTGEYNSNNQQINLLTGNYSGGNIYSAAPQDRPNTSTLGVPAQFTGTGVGSAIPASELGSIIVYTTILPGTTFTAPTVVPGTVRTATVNGVAVSTSVPPQTITGATTVAPQTTVVTTQFPGASATSQGGAGALSYDSSKSFGVSLLGALMYFLM